MLLTPLSTYVPKPPTPKRNHWSRLSKTLSIINKLLLAVFILSVFVYAFSLFGNKLPSQESIDKQVLTDYPIQTETEAKPFHFQLEGYSYDVTPKFDYEISGLVVSHFDYASWLNVLHKDDPGLARDFCLFWGKNITTDIYKSLKYNSFELTCWIDSDTNMMPDACYLSNNHLVPKNNEIKNRMQSVQNGDQIAIKGYLVDYVTTRLKDKAETFAPHTSIKRCDRDCEVIYVTDFTILKRSDALASVVHPYAKYASFGSFFSLLVSFFIINPIIYKRLKKEEEENA